MQVNRRKDEAVRDFKEELSWAAKGVEEDILCRGLGRWSTRGGLDQFLGRQGSSLRRRQKRGNSPRRSAVHARANHKSSRA